MPEAGQRIAISIHALREEGDCFPGLVGHLHVLFLSTPSARRATGSVPGRGAHYGKFLSTPSARRATSDFYFGGDSYEQISIHALREEGDASDAGPPSVSMNFYPRPPRGGRPGRNNRPAAPSDISIHALREEGDPRLRQSVRQRNISIHALREEGDSPRRSRSRPMKRFLSTPSARRATQCNQGRCIALKISIHALREEGDHHCFQWFMRN